MPAGHVSVEYVLLATHDLLLLRRVLVEGNKGAADGRTQKLLRRCVDFGWVGIGGYEKSSRAVYLSAGLSSV